MKKKNIFKHFTALLTTLVVAFSTFSSTIASAASIKTPEIHLSGWGYDFRNSKVTSNAYDPITKAYTNKNFRSVNGHYCKNYFPYWKDSSGRFSYCVQFQVDNVSTSVMESFDLKSNYSNYYTGKQAEYKQGITIFSKRVPSLFSSSL